MPSKKKIIFKDGRKYVLPRRKRVLSHQLTRGIGDKKTKKEDPITIAAKKKEIVLPKSHASQKKKEPKNIQKDPLARNAAENISTAKKMLLLQESNQKLQQQLQLLENKNQGLQDKLQKTKKKATDLATNLRVAKKSSNEVIMKISVEKKKEVNVSERKRKERTKELEEEIQELRKESRKQIKILELEREVVEAAARREIEKEKRNVSVAEAEIMKKTEEMQLVVAEIGSKHHEEMMKMRKELSNKEVDFKAKFITDLREERKLALKKANKLKNKNKLEKIKLFNDFTTVLPTILTKSVAAVSNELNNLTKKECKSILVQNESKNSILVQEMKEENELLKKELKKSQKALQKMTTKKESSVENLREKQRKIKQLTTKLDYARDELAYEQKIRLSLEKKPTNMHEIKKTKVVGRRGATRKWPVYVVRLILELLVVGSSPSNIPKLLQTMSTELVGKELEEIPSTNFVRQCRTVGQVVNEILVAIQLGRNTTWKQLFTDGTTRRQTEFQNLVIGVMDEKKNLTNIVVSSCMMLENATAKGQVQAIKYKFERLKQRLTDLRILAQKEFPDNKNLINHIPHPDGIDIKHLGLHGTLTSDTCNAAKATLSHLQDTIQGISYVQHCFNHLRCIWINGVLKSINAHLKQSLHDSLECIPQIFRVSVDMSKIILAYHKEFSLLCNYPKGHGEKFRLWMKKNHPGYYLFRSERSNGSRQDIVAMGSLAIYMNRHVNIDFLHEQVGTPNNNNVLQSNLYIVLSSLEVAATARFFSILHLAVVVPVRWLAAKTHELFSYQWGPRSMGRVVDILHENFTDVLKDPWLIHNEEHMMNMFDDLKQELPEFKKAMDFLLKNKKSTSIISDDGSRVIPMIELRKELFDPENEDNKKTTEIIEQIAVVGVEAFIKELEDKKKATHNYLSCMDGKYSYNKCSSDEKKEMLGCMAVNDIAESQFGGVTYQLDQYGRIGLHGAAGINDCRRNKFFERPISKKEVKEKKRGMFYKEIDEIQHLVILLAMKSAPAVMEDNILALEKQREAKSKKEELLREKGCADAAEDFINSLIYYNMSHSPACWKTNAEMNNNLNKMKFKKDQLQALKDNINIRVIGYNWKQFEITWSINGRMKSVDELKDHLKNILRYEKQQKNLPAEPQPKVQGTNNLPILGKRSELVRNLGERNAEKNHDLKIRAKHQLKGDEAKGKSDISSLFQDWVPPKVHKLPGKRIEQALEFLCEDGKTEIRWCKGLVKEVCRGRNDNWLVDGHTKKYYEKHEAAKIEWDNIVEDSGTYIKKHTTIEPIDPKKWNKYISGGWRYEFDIDTIFGLNNSA